jgi:hypothetical protein
MKRRCLLRPSFVVTLAATTALGCGATVNPPAIPHDSGVRPDVSTGNPPPLCPPTRPTSSDLCPYGFYAGSALRCQYDLCGDHYATETVCYGFGNGVTWTVNESSCNPPPPMCPPSPPDDGSACALPPIQCEWGVCRATCTSGRWSYEGPCLFDAGVGVDD